MRRIGIRLSLVLTSIFLVSLLSCTLAFADDDIVASGDCGLYGDNLIWTLDSDGLLTISGEGEMANYYDPVTHMSETRPPWASYVSDIKSLQLDEGITSIGNMAFENLSSLQGSLVIPDTVTTIGYSSFARNTGLIGTLEIPDSVITVEDNAFRYCTGFTKLKLGKGLKTIGGCAFGSSEYYNTMNFSGSLIIPDGVETIGWYAFGNCKKFTGNLVIPDSVKSIGDNAFWSCNGMKGSLELGNGLETIGAQAFLSTAFTGDLVIPSGIRRLENDTFEGSFTGSLVLPDSLTYIGSQCFANCGFTGELHMRLLHER